MSRLIKLVALSAVMVAASFVVATPKSAEAHGFGYGYGYGYSYRPYVYNYYTPYVPVYRAYVPTYNYGFCY